MKRYPLLRSQLGIFLECMQDPQSTQYNLPVLVALEPDVDPDRLEQAWNRLVQAKLPLHNRYELSEDGTPLQWPDLSMDIPLVRRSCAKGELDRYIAEEFVRPFHLLKNEPLVRAELVTTEKGAFLLVDIHHTIIDGFSYMQLLGRDLNRCYSGKQLSEDGGLYEAAAEEEQLAEREDYRAARSYFTEKFRNRDFVSLSNGDGSRTGRLLRAYSRLSRNDCDRWCAENGISPDVLFQSAFAYVMSMLCRQRQIAYGMSFHGRTDRRKMRSMGMFVNTLPISADMSPECTVRQLAESLRKDMDTAISYAVYPVGDLKKDIGAMPRIVYNYRADKSVKNQCILGDAVCRVTELARPSMEDDICVVIRTDETTAENYEILPEGSEAMNSRETMDMLAEAIRATAVNMMADPDGKLRDIPITSVETANAALELSRGKITDHDASGTWLSMFAKTVERYPDATAVVDENGSYTYRELDALSDRAAAWFAQQQVRENTFVAIRMGRSREFLAAAIGLHKIGAAYVPVDDSYPEERIRFMLEDSGVQLVVTEDTIRDLPPVDRCGALPHVTPEHHAYMIYTSGSTGMPKGVVIPHRALNNFIRFIRREWQLNDNSRIACHSNFAFDAAVEDLYPVLTVGGTLYIVPEEARKDIMLMRDYIKQNRITGGCYTTQFGQLLGADETIDVDHMVLGGERMTAVPNVRGRVINTYGPTEFTVDATWYVVDKEKTYSDIPIGRPLDNCLAMVMDLNGHLLPQGAAGELCLCGPQMAEGYWNRPEKTAEAFVMAELPDGTTRRLYRTGDLVRYDAEGELLYSGRIDNQIKLRGFRIELGEIENKGAGFAGILQISAQIRAIGQAQQICLYYTADRRIDPDRLKEYLAEKLPDYMVPVAYTQMPAMPYTANGKIDLRALPEPELLTGKIVAPETEMEKDLLRVIAEQLCLDNFGVTSNLISLGMSSLAAMRITVAIRNRLQVTVRVSDLMQHPTVRELARLIQNDEEGDQSALLCHQPGLEMYPITQNQRGILVDWEMNRDAIQYNIPGVYVFTDTDAGRLAGALKRAVNFHASMKVHLVRVNDDIMQQSGQDDPVEIPVIELKEQPDAAFFQSKIKPFDLFKDTLYRIALYTYENRVYLMMDIHHIVFDGLSGDVFMNDVMSFYQGREAVREELTSLDYALFEEKAMRGESLNKLETYFDSLVSNAGIAGLPASKRPDGHANGRVDLNIDKEKAGRIRAFCEENGVTPGSYFQAAFAQVLYSVTREERFLYLTISNGRSASAMLHNSVGMFVKTLPVVYSRDNVKPTMLVRDYVLSVHNQLQETFAREMYSYTQLVQRNNLHAEIMFAYQGEMTESGNKYGAEEIPLKLDTAKMPVTVSVFADHDSYLLSLEYDGTRYDQNDITALAGLFAHVSSQMAETVNISELSLVDAEEEKALTALGCGGAVDRDHTATVLSVFRDRVNKTPDAVGLIFRNKRFTYRELDELSDRIAVRLKMRYGIKREDNVGVMISRSELMLIYPLAVMKTGAAYMPLDPHFPAERLTFMCQDADVKALLTEGTLAKEKLPDYQGPLFNSAEIPSLPPADPEALSVLTAPDPHSRLAVLYTSGSTGRPKAVELEHDGVVNYCEWYVREFALTPDDRTAGYANFGFDAHMIDLYPSIMAGSAVVLFDDDIRMDIAALNRSMEENHVTVAFLTTQIACMIREINHSLRVLSTGGEKMPPVTPPAFRFVNCYGPTECSLFTTYYDVKGAFAGEYIGRPLPNYQLYVVDPQGRLLPRGFAGELLIAGEGIARGYLNRPDLTKEKFIRFRSSANAEAVRAYRSGDLVRWSADGNVEFLGRIDKQVKLRGLRIELGEIENKASSFPGIRQVVADVKGTQDQRLCCYYVSDVPIDTGALKAYLAESLTAYMVPEVYIALKALPLNPNGKVDRKALPEPSVMSDTEIVLPETAMEKQLFALTARLLGNDKFGVTHDLVSLGLSSLMAMRLSVMIYNQLSLQIRVPEIFADPTIRAVARFLSEKKDAAMIPHVEPRASYPIMDNQRGIYIDWEVNRNTTQYNIPNVYVFKAVDAGKLADAILRAAEIHTCLKTRFAMEDGDIVQKHCPELTVEIPVISLTREPDAAFFQELVRPFDLTKDALYRFALYCFADKTYLFMDIHHIIYDGLSSEILLNDILSFYKGETAPSESVTAYDMAAYVDTMDQKENDCWFDRLVEESSVLRYPGSAHPDGPSVGNVTARFPRREIDAFCGKTKVTVGSFMQAAYLETMHRLTREEHPLFLTISNGRSSGPQLRNTLGMFVITLPVVRTITNEQASALTTIDYVRGVHDQLQESFSREYYSFTGLVERHKLHAGMMFVFQGGMFEGGEVTNVEQIPLELDTSKFPIMVTVYPDAENYVIALEYNGTIYSAHDMAVIAGAFKNAAVTMAQKRYLREVQIVSTDEAEVLMRMSKGPDMAYDTSKTWMDLFLSHVRSDPDRLAVTDIEGSLTYAELDAQSDAVAHYLLRNGVQPRNFVVIKMRRFKEFAVAVLGIHKAAACYVPIDPDYPEDRIRYMEEDSEAKLLLTRDKVQQIVLEETAPEHINLARPEHLAYMIYTSGSTGKPKGAMIPHSALMNYVVHYIRLFEVTKEDRISHHITFSFDSHIRDFYPALGAGASLHFMPDEIRKEPDAIFKFLTDHRITGSAYATAMGQMMLTNYELKQRFVSVGGEALRGITGSDVRVFNVCGATEVTDVVCEYELQKGRYYENTPIGKALPNCWAFILDRYGNLVPRGIPGEICYVGKNIGEGYWHNPVKTKAAFTDCPLLPGQVMYHTGDIGRYNDDGDVEYMGRMDFQVKLRGFRIELGEVESRALRYEKIRMAAAEVRLNQLVLYFTGTEQVDQEQLKAFMASALTEYMVPTVFTQLDAMPMTPSGKINRKALPDPDLSGNAEFIENVGDSEKAVAGSMQKILGMDRPVGALDNFFELGGDSIKAIRMVSLLRQQGISLKVADVMKQKTVRAIASCITLAADAVQISQEPFTGMVPDTAIYRYFRYLELPVPNHYNQSMLLKLSERADKEMLTKAVRALAVQHDAFRAAIENDQLVFRSEEHIPVPEEYDLRLNTGVTFTLLCEDIQSHLDLQKALTRIALIHDVQADYLLIVMHHTVVDGVSWRIIVSDLETSYAQLKNGEAISLPAKTHTYNDYAQALLKYAQSAALRHERPYWEDVQKRLQRQATSVENDCSRDMGRLFVTLTPGDTAAFMHADLARLQLDINDVLLTSVCMSYRKAFGETGVSVQMEGHGREDIGEYLVTDRTVGWFTSIYPVVVENLNGEIGHDLRTVKEALHRVPNKGVGYNVLRFLCNDGNNCFSGNRVARIGFNYLGDMDVASSDNALFGISSEQSAGNEVSPKNVFGPDLSVNCYAIGDTLFGLMFDYNRALLNDTAANELAQDILENIKAIVTMAAKTEKPLLTPSDLGEDKWTQAEFDAVLADFGSRGERIERIYPLLPMQEGMLLHHLSKPDSWGYRLVSIFELDRVPTEDQLRKALERLGRKHEVLRTAIIHEGVGQPRQAIVDRGIFLDRYDYSNESDPLAATLRLRENILSYGFDLQKKTLFHVTAVKKDENTCYLLIGAHHIITDGWCNAIYMNDLMRLLNEEMTGHRTPDDIPARGVYEEAVREILRKDRHAGLAYWRKLLDGYDTRAEIPSNGPVPGSEQCGEGDLYTYLDEETTKKIADLCNQQAATLSNGMELLWGLILHTYNRTDDAVFAKVVSGRDKTKVDVDNVVGLFINSVPVRVKISETTTGREMLSELQKQTAASNEWDFCPLEEIGNETALGGNLLQNILAFENFDSGLDQNARADELTFHIAPVLLKEESFDELTPSMYLTDDARLCLHIAFDKTKYRKSEIEQLMKLFRVFARGLAEAPDKPLCRLPRVDAIDEAALMQLCRGDVLEYDITKTWIDLFLEQVRRAPDALAVSDRNSSYTYKELDEASDKLACRLREMDIHANDFVALKITRSKEFVAASLGVQKLGAAYVPIDLSYPEERIEYIIRNSEAKLLLEDEQVRAILSGQQDYVPVNEAKPESYAYMIYTSGSTGKPKGVVLHQRGLLNNSMVLWRLYALTPGDRISAHRSFSFDSHIEDFYPTLISGASVHILPEDIRKDPGLICDFLKEHHITGGGYSTAMAMILLSDYHLDQRFITCGGEALKGVVSGKVQVINEYGPTECTCDASAYKLEPGRSYDMIPIGRPWPNGWCFIVDRHGNLLPRGLSGELCYASPQVGYGYWKLPENTRKSYTDCPFVPGLRMYRTSDLARYNDEGDLLCLGRIDFQVKLRGYRIELGEIEATAIHHPDIRQAVAQIRHDNIVLYYTAHRPVNTEALKVFLSGALAEYMVPAMYMELKEMPMTPNGKINLKTLPDPNAFDQIRNEPPANPKEANVLAIARELIPDVEFGVTDDLRSVGLTSIKAMKLAARISSELMLNIRVSDIMRFGNIRACLNNEHFFAWLYEAYNSEKPTLVVVHGIVHVNDLKHLMESWKKYFNLLVIEPIQVHYHPLFVDETFNDVTGFYTEELGIFLPKDADIFGFAGFSFGGELALGMAADYEDQTGKKTFVLMGDSFISGPADMEQEDIPFETVDHIKETMLRLRNVHVPDDIAKESVMANNIVLQVRAHKQMRVYDGPVRFMMAYAYCDAEDIDRKREMITTWAPNVRIDDFKDQSHEGLFKDPEMHGYFEKLFEERLKEGN